MKKQPHPKIEKDYRHHMDMYFPPLMPMPDIPVCLHYGSYMIKRRYDVHTGVDLYAPVGASVYGIEKGEVVAIRDFTGTNAGCSHWNTTWDVCIEGYTGIFSYGEIEPVIGLKIGDEIHKGQNIGKVMQVLKKDKGKAMSMLHFSIHTHGWKHLLKDQEDPEQEHFYDMQIDPTPLLIQLKAKSDLMMAHMQLDGMIMQTQKSIEELWNKR